MPKFWQDIRVKISDITKYIVKKLSILLLKGWNWRGKEKTNSYKKITKRVKIGGEQKKQLQKEVKW